MASRVVWVVDDQTFSHELDQDRNTIGRALDNDITILSNSISRRHACVYRDGDSWRVEDLGSRNGTKLNDSDSLNSPLRNGDVIALGRTELRFVDDLPDTDSVSIEAFDPSELKSVRSAMQFGDLARSLPENTVYSDDAERMGRLVATVTEASKTILESKSLDDTFRLMLDLIFRQLPAERGFILLRDDERRDLSVRCSKTRGSGAAEVPMRVSRTIADQVLNETVTVLTTDAQGDSRFAAGESVFALGIRSAIAAPIWSERKVEGLICLDSSLERAFREFDADLVSALGHHLAIAMERARLQALAIEKERLDRELAVARAIQVATLPSVVPAIPGYDLAGLSRPAEATGGDTYDLVPAGDDRRLILLLGDATGHGIGPALSVTQVRSMLRVAMRLEADLDSAFRHINDQLSEDLDDARFVTAFIGMLDAVEHEVRYHSGGQGPIMHYHRKTERFDWHKATTTPMGFLPITEPPEACTIRLGPGDILGLMTDGVFETESERGEMFGTTRVEALVRSHADKPADAIASAILEAIDDFAGATPQADDITIVLVHREVS